jgi:hypothetical protein
MRALLAYLIVFCIGTAAHAACSRPPGPAPIVPNGATADAASMSAAHDAIQAYVNSLEAYQACLLAQTKDTSEEISPELKMTWIAQGDAALDAAQALANAFSVALKTFKERPAPK